MINKRYNVSVFLNVYDLHPCNGCLWYFGFGLYHCGVQLKYTDNMNRHSKEYSYLGNTLTESTGVFHCQPKHTFGAKFRTALNMGTIQISNRELSLILDKLRSLYLAKDYDILLKNCNHFCDEFVYELTSKHIASWLNRTASFANCCNCCIPQSFFDALISIQTNYNQNSDHNHHNNNQKKKYISWIYSNSYLKDSMDATKKCKKKIIKNGNISAVNKPKMRCVHSESEIENDIVHDHDHETKQIEKIDNYMNYKHSVSVVGLKCNDKQPNMKPITNTNLGINPLNEHIILTNIPKLKTKHDENTNNRSHIKKYIHSNGFNMRLSPHKLSVDTTVANNSENKENDSDTSINWNNDSYQRLPKTPTCQKSIDST